VTFENQAIPPKRSDNISLNIRRERSENISPNKVPKAPRYKPTNLNTLSTLIIVRIVVIVGIVVIVRIVVIV
jgi:hypothetical protein